LISFTGIISGISTIFSLGFISLEDSIVSSSSLEICIFYVSLYLFFYTVSSFSGIFLEFSTGLS